ncbi:YbaB/EbfC family nucleoid-associated protein [Plantactinospora sp. CA-290183]|uniref:YbaB/EbfC family nucleoid-associated protein n=1 Tax=Plantactinospora sp. CA-290183 TaxID=3240006 RepID=UPI003D8E78E6
MAIGMQPGGGGILDPDGAMEHLSAWKGQIDRLAADTRAMSDRLDQLRVTATDDNGLAQVTIDHTGALVDLRLTPRIQRVAPEAVSRAIMNTIQGARKKAADRAREIIAETVGVDSPAARTIAERVDQQLRGVERGTVQTDRDPYRW